MKIIDSHQHFWKYDPEQFPWITDSLYKLKRDFLPSELRKVYAENKIAGCIAVQAAQTVEETRYLLELAENNEFIKGVVGWIDLRAASLKEELREFASFEKLKGFRHILQDEADPNFISHPDFQRGLEIIFEVGYTYDILVFPNQLKGALDTASRFTNASFVIDHLAKPDIKHQSISDWKELMHEFKDLPNVYCKLSGMVTENDWRNWKLEDFFPYLDVMMDVFGQDRLMFGSDWPVCLLAASYGEVKGVLEAYLADFPEEVQTKIWSENAIKFYKIKD
ncbi:amidohydrolase family protein [Lunatibacter salilacus]|uniref:amidohydrolase family protein n=1 Tax=Lunatibacter salilacus TaxID=2483804 RepID=UPI00131B1028|nr:amidohydrolase family protein [Lunatibacter salilacus]